ncbi:GIY-YIG nuclease family protein [Bosea sp. F3-2]|uniref:GIY-YIG nuclease family protein n=1 Tax=Bosea sp. F3-2 TaxID=2599640 RepID=UPI0011EE2CC3|nr:GIY-YIG nuclease family protein [Bosea sp. F3-2]QEL24425.1 GIY-YIG nuclease family protein [Bosea sp. F3-2]
MRSEDRKAATAAYKERKSVAGIYAFRCEASGQIWVGRAPDLATIENRLRFTLRHGSHRQRSLQTAWNAQGSDAFRFEALERLEDEDIAYVLDRVLKERLAHWQAKLNAEAL